VATIREKRPGVWEVRAFTGRDDRGRPTQVSRTVHGTKRNAQRAAAEMTSTSPVASTGPADALPAAVARGIASCCLVQL
jgi:hypothetical protein